MNSVFINLLGIYIFVNISIKYQRLVINKPNLHFRPIELADQQFLFDVYANTRENEMELLSFWGEPEKLAFLTQQFLAQQTYYQQQFPSADYLIILIDQLPVGRLYLDRRPEDIRIIDISILTSFRNLGYGSYILHQLTSEAQSVNKTLTIHVERSNPALHLYDRIGFRILDDSHPIYLLMKWSFNADV